MSRNKLVKEQARVVFKSYIFSAVGIVHCKSYGENIFFIEAMIAEWKKPSSLLDLIHAFPSILLGIGILTKTCK